MFRDVKGDQCKKRRRLGVGLRIWDLDPRAVDSGKVDIREKGGERGQGICATTGSKMRRMAREELPGAEGEDGGPGSLGTESRDCGSGACLRRESGPRDEPGLVRKPAEPAVLLSGSV